MDRNSNWLSESRIGTARKIGDDIVKIRHLLVGFILISEPAIFVCLQSSSHKQLTAKTTAQGELQFKKQSKKLLTKLNYETFFTTFKTYLQ